MAPSVTAPRTAKPRMVLRILVLLRQTTWGGDKANAGRKVVKNRTMIVLVLAPAATENTVNGNVREIGGALFSIEYEGLDATERRVDATPHLPVASVGFDNGKPNVASNHTFVIARRPGIRPIETLQSGPRSAGDRAVATFLVYRVKQFGVPLNRQCLVLRIDIERTEACDLGDLTDPDRPGEAHRHRRYDLAPAKLFPHVVTQDSANSTLPETPQREDKTTIARYNDGISGLPPGRRKCPSGPPPSALTSRGRTA
jgi:hypothetical protein